MALRWSSELHSEEHKDLQVVVLQVQYSKSVYFKRINIYLINLILGVDHGYGS